MVDCINGRTNEWIVNLMHRRMDGYYNRWMVGLMDASSLYVIDPSNVLLIQSLHMNKTVAFHRKREVNPQP